MAEDLTQGTFAIAVEKIHQFRGECKVSTWLCQIAKHLWYKELKKMQKNKSISIDELPADFGTQSTTEELILQTEEKLKLFKSMQKLDELSRQVIYLRCMGNLNFIEIAEVLGKTPNWARVTFFRAKQKMKEENEHGKENGM